MRGARHSLRAVAAALLGGVSLGTLAAHAQDATWQLAPPTADWNTPANWTPATVPTGIATFGASTKTSLTFQPVVDSIGTIQFNAGAPAYTFNLNNNQLTVNGAGIVNNSANKPTFLLDQGSIFLPQTTLNFTNSATAGNANITASHSAFLQFFNTSSAANATIDSTNVGQLIFWDSSTAGSAKITGSFDFQGSSNAGNAQLIVPSGNDLVAFEKTSSAANAQISVASGAIGLGFFDSANAGSAVIDNSSAGVAVLGTGGVFFVHGSSAGNATITNNSGAKLTFGNFAGAFADFTHGTGTAGNATIINNGGSTIFFNQSDAGTASITNATNGTLTFNGTSSASSAHINTTGTGTAITFNNSSTAANATFTANPATNGTITFNNTSTAANAHIDLVDTSLVFNNSTTAGNAIVTMSNVMHPGNITFNDMTSAGSANITNVAVTVLGASVQFLGASTAGNATITNNPNPSVFQEGGVLNFGILGGAGTANAGTATIINNQYGTSNFFAQTSAMNASITNNFGGASNFQDQATAANATIVNNAGGGVFFGDQATAGSAHITNQAGGSVDFGFSGLYPAIIDTATAGNATIVNNGTVTFNSATTGGNATITTNSGGSVFFFDASSGGNARFITNAGGTFDMSGLTTAGMTAGSIEGAGNYFLGSKALTVGSNGLSTTVSGVISDGGTGGGIGGSLAKVGAGALTLTGVSTYTGATTVNAGTLLVNGSIVSSSGLTVNAGGTVGGGGILPKTTINGGTLSPGNSIGTISITGSLTFVGAGNYLVEVSPAAADKTNVSGAPGTAALSGTLSAVGLGGSYAIGTKYTVLNATGGVSGTFANLAVSGNFGATKPHIEYDANNVYLVLDPNALSLTGLTPNQRAVATTVNAAVAGGAQLAPFNSLFALSAAQLPGGLDALSGEVHASTAGLLVDESLYARSAVLGRLRQASYGGDVAMAALSSGGPQLAYADDAVATLLAYDAKSPLPVKAPLVAPAPSRDIAFWAQGFGAWGRFDGDGNAAGVRRDLAGFFSGVDARIGDGRAGIAAGYTASRNNLDGRGRADVETGHVATYGGWSFGALNLRGGGAYAWHTIDTSRTVALPGFFDAPTAHYNGSTGQVFGEAGYGVSFGKVAVEPFAGAAFVHLQADAFNERGGAAALRVAANSFELGYSNVGIRAATLMPLAADMVLVPRVSVSWQHAFGDVTPDALLAFQGAGAPFAIAGVPLARDSVLAEAGLDLAIGRHATLGVSYTGQLANNVQDHAAKGKFTWKF